MAITHTCPEFSGIGFFITEDGYLITNEHVIRDAVQVRLVTETGIISAKVVKVDVGDDLALLKADGNFSALPLVSSRGARLGATVATLGFPNIGLQGFSPKFAKGEIAGLAGVQDDARHFQISTPIQPGNSGGALLDERGNVVGVVVAKLSQRAALAASGTLAENGLITPWDRLHFMMRDFALWLGACEEGYPQRSLPEHATTPRRKRSIKKRSPSRGLISELRSQKQLSSLPSPCNSSASVCLIFWRKSFVASHLQIHGGYAARLTPRLAPKSAAQPLAFLLHGDGQVSLNPCQPWRRS